MRAIAWAVLASLAAGCVLAPSPLPGDDPPAPSPDPSPPTAGSPTAPAPTIPGPALPGGGAPPSGEPGQGASEPPPAPGEGATPGQPAPDAPAPEGPPYEVAPGWTPPDDDGPRASPTRTVRFEPGLDEPDGTFVLSWERADDGLGFVAQLAAVADATVEIDSLSRIVSTAPRDVTIVLSAQPLADPLVTTARLALWDGAGLLGELDLLQPAPSFETTISPGDAFDLAWTLSLAEGAEEGPEVAVTLDVAT